MSQAVTPYDAHILVVAGTVPDYVVLARQLAFMGVIHCEWKTSGWQVVQFADTLPRLHLILMDIHLPYEDPFQTLAKMRQHPRLRDTRIAAISANGDREEIAQVRAAGFDGLLRKPFDPDQFPEQIRRLLAGEAVWP
jgi:two-component system cell cycle response regulator DivK